MTEPRIGSLDEGRRGDIVALAITVFGGWLRVHSLGDWWNSADEGIYYHVSHSSWEIARELIGINAHPPLYYLVLRGAAGFGDEMVWLRLPALVCGTASIFALHRLGRRLDGPVCGWLAAGIFAVSPGAVMLSQIARPYALLILALIAALTALERFVDGGGRRALVAYALWMSVALATHYGSYFALLGFVLAVTVAGFARRLSPTSMRDLAIAHVPLLLVIGASWVTHVGPFLLGSSIRAEARGAWLGNQFTSDPGELWENFLGMFDLLAGAVFSGGAVVAFLISLVLAVYLGRGVRVALPTAAMLVVAVTASALALYPFGGTRHSAYLLPVLALPIAWAASYGASRGWRAGAATAVVLVVLGVASSAVGRVLGIEEVGYKAEPERSIRADEPPRLAETLAGLRDTPGVVFADLSTAYTLLPTLGDDPFHAPWIGTGGASRFRWGERTVVVLLPWYLRAGAIGVGEPNHLATVIAGIRRSDPTLSAALEVDTRVISAAGMRVPREVRALASDAEARRALVGELARTEHLSVFRLDLDLYGPLLRERLRDVAVGH